MLGRKAKRGQALVELIPVILVLVAVVTAMASWYRMTRSAVIREEVTRNLAFAKIGNVGTLTTPYEQMNTGLKLGDSFSVLGPQQLTGTGQFIDANTRCVMLRPAEANKEHGFEAKILNGLGSMSVTNYSLIVRSPGGCQQFR